MAKYLQVAYSEGKFFEYSKTAKEGFVEYKNKEGVLKGYRGFMDAIEGTLESMRVVPNKYLQGNPEELQVTFKDASGDYLVVTMMMLDQNKDYSTFVESLVLHLPQMTKGAAYKVTPYNFVNDNGAKFAGYSIKNGEEKVEKLTEAKIYKDGTVKEGVVPAVTWTEDRRTGKPTPNSEEKFFYLKGVLDTALETFKYVEKTQDAPAQKEEAPVSTPKAAPKKTTPAATSAVADDDLPF